MILSINRQEATLEKCKQLAPYPLRLEPEMRETLRRQAMENGRSLHSEIIQRLKKSLGQSEKLA